jgi:RimJ/RimL family protein N-acetyltransferase
VTATVPAELVIETERLWIRQWRDADAPRVLDIQSRWEVVRWLDDDPQVMTTLDEAHEQVATWRRAGERHGSPCGHWAVEDKASGTVVGATMLLTLPGLNRPPGVREIQVGWHLHPDSTGRGYAREAAGAALAYGLDQGLDVVRALMFADNVPSAKVARALGMREVGVVEDRWYPGTSLVFVSPPDSESVGTFR